MTIHPFLLYGGNKALSLLEGYAYFSAAFADS
jgi:hypothetical protein